MPTTTIDIDVYPNLDLGGISTSVYLGETDEPVEVQVPWEQIIETEMEYHCVPYGGPIVVSRRTGCDGVATLYEMIEKLRDVANQLEANVKERGILLRDKWEDVNNEAEVSRDDFVVDYAEYLNYIMGESNDE